MAVGAVTLLAGCAPAPAPVPEPTIDLPVREADSSASYSREAFGQKWSDDVEVEFGHNGCDTRNDILRRDLSDAAIKPGTRGCVVLSGTLTDPYTGEILNFERGNSAIQIDHVVALSNAWRTGAQALDDATRRDFANDPLNLIAVSGTENIRKRNSDVAEWLPPNSNFHCDYVQRQIAVKSKYQLWLTPDETQAMQEVLKNCPK